MLPLSFFKSIARSSVENPLVGEVSRDTVSKLEKGIRPERGEKNEREVAGGGRGGAKAMEVRCIMWGGGGGKRIERKQIYNKYQ